MNDSAPVNLNMLAMPEIMAFFAFLRVSASALDLNEDWRNHSELGASAIGRKWDCRLSWTATEFTWTWVEGGGSIDDTSSDGIDDRSCTIFESP